MFVGANGKDTVFLAVSGRFESARGDKCLVTSTGTYTAFVNHLNHEND